MSNELIIDLENTNDFLLNIMRENNVNFVCVGMPATNHYSSSIEQKMLTASENAREHVPILNQVHYNTGGPTRILSREELLNEWYNRMFEHQSSFRQKFEQEFMLNHSTYFDEINTRNSYYANDLKDRLYKREISREEFKKEILSRSKPKNDWFRRKHEKKRFIKGL